MTDETADIPCQLYPVLTPEMVLNMTDNDLQAFLDAAKMACLRLTTGPKGEDDSEDQEQAARRLIEPAQARDIAVVLDDAAEMAMSLGADGCHLSRLDELQALRSELPDGIIIGVDCGLSRHEAICAAEEGADYVAFGPCGENNSVSEEAAAHIAWWADLIEVPSVVSGGVNFQNAATLAQLGANFIMLEDVLAQHEQGPAAALAQISAVLGK